MRVDLGSLDATNLFETDLFRRVDLSVRTGGADRASRSGAFILFGLGGPSMESLRAEFLAS